MFFVFFRLLSSTLVLTSRIGQKIKLLIRHKQQGFEPQTSMDQGRTNAPSMGIELDTIGWMIVALAN